MLLRSSLAQLSCPVHNAHHEMHAYRPASMHACKHECMRTCWFGACRRAVCFPALWCVPFFCCHAPSVPQARVAHAAAAAAAVALLLRTCSATHAGASAAAACTRRQQNQPGWAGVVSSTAVPPVQPHFGSFLSLRNSIRYFA